MATVNDAWIIIKSLFDELSKNGSPIGEASNKDLELKAIPLINMAQKELIDISRNIKTFSYERKSFKNELNDVFDVKSFIGDDYVTEGVMAKTYSFKVNEPATVIIQEYVAGSWQDLTTLNVLAPEEGYNTYNGVTGTSGLTRLKFTGTTYYLFKDIALWDIEFTTIPDYGKWIKVPLPSNLKVFKDLNIDDEYGYGRAGTYRLEGEDTLYVSHDFEGQLRGNYYAYPADVTALTDELEVSEDKINYLAFYAATYLAPNEQPTLTVLFEEKYLRLETKLNKPVQPGHVPIRNTLQIGRLGGI